MALFGGRASMLEVQNRALIKTAAERAQRISELERELQPAFQEAERLKAEMQRLKLEMERLRSESEFYYNRVLELEQYNREVTASATKYSLWGQSLERELAIIDPAGTHARGFEERESHESKFKSEGESPKAELERLKREREFYYSRVLTLEKHNHELTATATKYSLWGQKLERELAKIDPDGAPGRRFRAQDDP